MLAVGRHQISDGRADEFGKLDKRLQASLKRAADDLTRAEARRKRKAQSDVEKTAKKEEKERSNARPNASFCAIVFLPYLELRTGAQSGVGPKDAPSFTVYKIPKNVSRLC